MRVYIGYDPTEHEAYEIARFSLLRHASIPVDVIPLTRERLQAQGILTRPTDMRGGIYDMHSNAPASTEFAISRFAVPLLAHSGLALFVDCDMVFCADVAELLPYAERHRAVYVVKHHHEPSTATKMGGAVQTTYSRKNWSSVMLFDCDHTANQRLNLQMLNTWPGRDLHRFGWLHDTEIGELEPGWNWLVGEQPQPEHVKIAHYTLGGPWIRGWQQQDTDELWLHERRLLDSAAFA
jgi:hypothetical protein